MEGRAVLLFVVPIRRLYVYVCICLRMRVTADAGPGAARRLAGLVFCSAIRLALPDRR